MLYNIVADGQVGVGMLPPQRSVKSATSGKGKLTRDDEFGVEQLGVLLQPVVVDVAGLWVHLHEKEQVCRWANQGPHAAPKNVKKRDINTK